MDYQQRATQATPAIDEGLRNYMLQVYNYMASGLALTGLVAYMLYQAIGGSNIEIINTQLLSYELFPFLEWMVLK